MNFNVIDELFDKYALDSEYLAELYITKDGFTKAIADIIGRPVQKYKMNEELLKDEFEQALKRRNKDYADGYVEGLKDGHTQANPVDATEEAKITASIIKQ